MATFTIAQMLAAGVPPAALDVAGTPGMFMAEWELDGAKKAIAATDFCTFFEIPTYTQCHILSAGVEILRAGTASGTIDIGIAGTDITGLTAWATDGTAGTKLVKAATVAAAQAVITTSSVSTLTVQQNTAALGVGRYRIRVFGYMVQM